MTFTKLGNKYEPQISANQFNKEQELKQLKILIDKYKNDVLEYLKHD